MILVVVDGMPNSVELNMGNTKLQTILQNYGENWELTMHNWRISQT